MAENIDLSSLIITRTWQVPIKKKELFNTISNELHKLFPPLQYRNWWFYQPAWNLVDKGEYMEFSLKLEYFYIITNVDPSKDPFDQYQRLLNEYKKNHSKIINKSPSIISNSYPYQIHINILKNDETNCEIELICQPFLYWNLLSFKGKVDNMEKEHSIFTCEQYLKKLASGLQAKDVNITKDDLSEFTEFLGIDKNWMSSTCALQLQEVAVTMVAAKKGIKLDKRSVGDTTINSEPNEPAFNKKYEAFSIEVKRLCGIDMPRMTTSLRDMRKAVLHQGYNPKEEEKAAIILFTEGLLRKLETVYKAN